MIRRVCCVCKIVMGEVADGQSEVRDSHGYCPSCGLIAMNEINQYTEEKNYETRQIIGGSGAGTDPAE